MTVITEAAVATAAGAPAYLVQLGATGQPEAHYALVGMGTWTIGRSDRAAIVLSSPWVSRMHALIQRLGEQEFYVIDLGSRNGTFVNGRRVTVPVRLQHRDEVTFGQTRMQFTHHASAQLTPNPALATPAWDHPTSDMRVRCLMTVVVMDLRDFTPLVRQIPESLLAQVVGTWFRQVGDIVQRYGSQVDKYIGDAVMAVWFHAQNEPRPGDWLRILRAVWGTHRATSNLHVQYPLPFPLRLGTGINTGYAMVGNTGTGHRPEYTALGDTVNAAFHLEAVTKSLGMDLLVGGTTYHYLAQADLADWLTPQQVQLKHQTEPVTVWGSSYDRLRRFLYDYGLVEPPTRNPLMEAHGFV
ncbi:MAG: adenylate/guanylate cyclase domain-containing protein [Gloeomargarita sp. SKYBB_i_bin120]|nr:adenylate/guanylate cyclase domain-containing protein [Gloeomargarita sp. SKYG98]MCS7292293.1 adenylate/guanylate cyclase domain-containing protein [Gloeomargarita sp. SKYB120]MDW8177853.1 adenylate/guanylate cyclase domain-containing protein [Gloeomargarita sp. SKYBB_i_bin120]